MKNIRLVLAGVCVVSLQSCTLPDWRAGGRVTRYVSIARDHFAARILEVPANEPFTLVINATDESSNLFTVWSPDIGLKPTDILVHAHGFSAMETHQPRRTEIILGPLVPGSYRLLCDCHSDPSVLTLIAAPLAH